MDVGSGLYLGGTGWQTDMLSTLACSGGYDEVKFWNLLAQVGVMPNVYVHGEYAFAADGKGAAGDPDDTWTLSLNYILSRGLRKGTLRGPFSMPKISLESGGIRAHFRGSEDRS